MTDFHQGSVSVMIVEDESVIALELKERLVEAGYNVLDMVNNGELAVQKAGELKPDIILMDIMLKGPIDGIDAAGKIHSKFDIPIIYLTAYADVVTLERAKITEPFGYILKPFEERELQTNIEMALYKHRMGHRLRESEQWLSTTLKSIADGVIATDSAGKIKFMNPVAELLTGWKEDKALGVEFDKVFNLVYEDSLKPAENPIGRVLKDGIVIGLAGNILLVSKDGTKRNIFDVAAPIKDEQGKLHGCVLVFQDISEKRKTEISLKKSEEKFRNLVETTSDWVWEFDTEGVYTYASPKVFDLLGYKPEDFIGHTKFDFMTKKNNSKTYDRFMEIIRGRSPFRSVENKFIHKDGSEVILESNGLPIFDEGKKFIGYRGIDRDITERKKIESELQKSTEELIGSKKLLEQRTFELSNLNEQLTESERALKELNINKDKFFSILAHDLRSPFYALLGFSKLLYDDYDNLSNRDKKNFVGDVYRSTKNLYHLIENLLDWSRLQTGRIEFNPTRFNLRELVINVFYILLGSAINKGIKLKNDIGEKTFVYADERMVHSVIQNLISNGIKFTKPGGEVRITSENKGEIVEIKVSDTGVGIKKEDMEKLFRIDVQHYTEGTSEEKGTGLGLILSKELVEKNDGKISVESEVGKGSAFKFTVPASRIENS